MQSEYDSLFTTNIYQGADSEHGMIITATAGYRAGARVWDITVPDLSPVARWLPQAALRADLVTKITMTATGASRRVAPDDAAILGAGRTVSATAVSSSRQAPAVHERDGPDPTTIPLPRGVVHGISSRQP